MTGQQSSRSGLIAWSVVATILFAVSAILAIISYVNGKKEKDLRSSLESDYAKVVSRSNLSRLSDLQREAGSRQVLDYLIEQRELMNRLISGVEGASPEVVNEALEAALNQGQTALGSEAALPRESVVAALAKLSEQLTARTAEIEKTNADLATARAAAATAQSDAAAVLAAKDKEVSEANQRLTALTSSAQADRDQQSQAFSALGQTRETEVSDLQNNINTLNSNIALLQREVQTLTGERDQAIQRLNSLRGDTHQIARAPDGRIVRVAGDRVFIDLGAGQQIAPGLTFEVYSQLGIPTPTSVEADADEELKGKASIQVIRVRPGTSEARIIRLTPGETLVEGDLISNLVYDRNIAYNFFVFGQFNLDNRGEASERDTEIVKRLVVQWGGKTGDAISTDTDFVVLGDEPVVPNYSQQEVSDDPLKAFEVQEAQKALDEYNDVRSKAIGLNIPVLNQNRFLYLVGYYEEAGR